MSEHEEITAAVLGLAKIVGEQPAISDDQIVERLVEAGQSVLAAEKLCVFCPSAFSWAIPPLQSDERLGRYSSSCDRR